MRNLERTKLVWKYFLKQKYCEIYDHLEEWVIIYVTASLGLSIIMLMGWLDSCKVRGSMCKYTPLNKTLGIIGLCIVGFWLVVLLVYVLFKIFGWLKDNWETANEMADRELERLKSQKGRRVKA